MSLSASSILDRTTLSRAPGCIARLAENVDLLPSVVEETEEAVRTRLQALTPLFSDVLTARAELTHPQHCELVNTFIAFYANLEVEKLATMHHLQAADLQKKLHALDADIVRASHSRHRSMSLPLDMVENMSTINAHISQLLTPELYPRATMRQHGAHIISGATRDPMGSAVKAAGTAAAGYVVYKAVRYATNTPRSAYEEMCYKARRDEGLTPMKPQQWKVVPAHSTADASSTTGSMGSITGLTAPGQTADSGALAASVPPTYIVRETGDGIGVEPETKNVDLWWIITKKKKEISDLAQPSIWDIRGNKKEAYNAAVTRAKQLINDAFVGSILGLRSTTSISKEQRAAACQIFTEHALQRHLATLEQAKDLVTKRKTNYQKDSGYKKSLVRDMDTVIAHLKEQIQEGERAIAKLARNFTFNNAQEVHKRLAKNAGEYTQPIKGDAEETHPALLAVDKDFQDCVREHTSKNIYEYMPNSPGYNALLIQARDGLKEKFNTSLEKFTPLFKDTIHPYFARTPHAEYAELFKDLHHLAELEKKESLNDFHDWRWAARELNRIINGMQELYRLLASQ